MKRALFKGLAAIVSATVLTAFFSCSSGDDDSKNDDSVIIDTSPTSYTNLSIGRAYIGGSLIYNQEDSSTNQLKPGTIIAVREGTVSSSYETREVYEPPAGFDSNTTYDTANLRLTTKEVLVSEDKPELAVFGYMTISNASLESISFSYTRYNSEGTGKSSKSYTINYGEGADINGDGLIDIKYREPNQIRDGFENSRWLEFVCDTEVLTKQSASTTTTMFSVVSTGSVNRALVRAVDGASVENSEYGLYGVNSNGNFIYLVKNSTGVNSNGGSLSSVYQDYNLRYGDFVIAFNEDTADSLTNGEVENTTQSFVVSYSESSATNTTLNNKTLAPIYQYKAVQFQSDDGPADLLKRMPSALLAKVENGLTQEGAAELSTEESINALNKILALGKEATDILLDQENGLVDEEMSANAESVLTELLAQNKEQAVRRIIDSLFVQSPKADLLSPSIESMYPYLAIDLGDSIEQTVEEEDLSAARMAKSLTDYESQKKSIKKKFDQYFSIELKKIDLGKKKDKDGNVEKDENGKEKVKTATLSDYGIKFALGVKGSLSVTGSQIKAGIGGVIYLDIGVSLADSVFDQIKKELEDKLKAEVKKTVMVGPVPITVGTKLKFGLGLKIATNTGEPIDLVFGYVGLYGAGVDAGARWGVEWKGWWIFKAPIPYINFFADPYTVNETAWYFGAASGKVEAEDLLKPLDVTLTPSLTLEPLFGLGPEWANFNVSIPITPSLPLWFYYNPLTLPIPLLHRIDLGLGISIKAGVDIKILIFSLSHSFINYKIIDKEGEKAWTLWQNKQLEEKFKKL
ncbi:hypothetical protein [uncultured Treponema sp.]|uniref:hypothetical protein n=1 Tax=uncultured Treponema sp. TaxID=162155 RepID=UPI0025E4CCD0|nr:hypothetical protein [uncultured Treponema sp.]